MSIEEILDDMEQLLEKAGSVPFAQHKAIIDGERLAELINDIRLNLPQEIKHAKMVAFDRDRIIKEAEAKAELDAIIDEMKEVCAMLHLAFVPMSLCLPEATYRPSLSHGFQ